MLALCISGFICVVLTYFILSFPLLLVALCISGCIFWFQPTPGLPYMFVLLPFSIAINLTYHNYSELNIINLLNYSLCKFELFQYCYLFSFRIYWCFSPYYNLKIIIFFFFWFSIFIYFHLGLWSCFLLVLDR